MSKRAAFFDLDETLIGVNSANLWVKYMWEQGQLGAIDLVRSMGWMLRYKLALIDMESVVEKLTQRLEGTEEAQMADDVRQWFEREVKQHFIPEMVERVDEHRAQGHHLVLLTASSPYVSRPVVEHLELHDYLCTRFEVEDGVFTGNLDGPMCYGAGKLELARDWASRYDIELESSYFYTDSYTDLPMFERVGHPVAVNADPRLARHAERQGYPTLRYDSPVRRST